MHCHKKHPGHPTYNSVMHLHEKLNYVEFPAKDLEKSKHFFTAVFGWAFVDYGEAYTAFAQQGLDGGFYQSDKVNLTTNGGALLVFYSADIEATQEKIIAHGGDIIQPIFTFPGGCRFHFTEPNGNEFAVWSESRTPV